MLVMQGGLAEFYSDNLSQEVKKGLAERKAQGLYNGALPFGAAKGDDGLPIPHPDSYPGLVKVFDLAAPGKTDSEIARALNADGYRTVGPRGNRSFATSSVRGIITNPSIWAICPTAKVATSKVNTTLSLTRQFGTRPRRCDDAGSHPVMPSAPQASA